MKNFTHEYTTLFNCLFDEKEANTKLPVHYSIFRTIEWLDVMREPLDCAQLHDFAVIWDEDHDERIITVLEEIYLNGLLSPVQFIGEHKGTLTVILAAKFYWNIPKLVLKQYELKLKEIVSKSPIKDCWVVEIGMFDKSPGSPQNYDVKNLIGSCDEEQYLRSIDFLWNLGTKNLKRNLISSDPLMSSFPTAF